MTRSSVRGTTPIGAGPRYARHAAAANSRLHSLTYPWAGGFLNGLRAFSRGPSFSSLRQRSFRRFSRKSSKSRLWNTDFSCRVSFSLFFGLSGPNFRIPSGLLCGSRLSAAYPARKPRNAVGEPGHTRYRRKSRFAHHTDPAEFLSISHFRLGQHCPSHCPSPRSPAEPPRWKFTGGSFRRRIAPSSGASRFTAHAKETKPEKGGTWTNCNRSSWPKPWCRSR